MKKIDKKVVDKFLYQSNAFGNFFYRGSNNFLI